MKRSFRRFFRAHKRTIRLSVFVIFMIFSLLYLYFMRVFPAMCISANSLLNIEMNKTVTECCLEYFERNSISDPIEISYSTDKRVTGINVKVDDINRARFSISHSILNMLNSSSVKTIELPLGCIFDSSLIYGKGPAIKLRVLSGNNFKGSIESKFTERGINQTMFELYMTFYIEVTVSMPLRTTQIPISTSYLLAQTLIVGEVPEAFTDINRTFDDITESEIDDINDFGAQI